MTKECLLTAGAVTCLLHLAQDCLTLDEQKKFAAYLKEKFEKHDRDHGPYNAGDICSMYDHFVATL